MDTPDDADLQRFIDEHYGRLVGLLRLRGVSELTAEDVAQDAMIRVVENWPRVQSLENPWAWLVRVAMNLTTSRWRRLRTASSRQHLLRREAESSGVHYDTAAVDALALLETLTGRQRVAVVLRYYAGLSVRETAELMGVAEGTVKSLCAGGLESARRALVRDTNTASQIPLV